VNDEPRRVSDQLIKDLIKEVQDMREEMQPVREFMDQITATKSVLLWGFGVIAAVGGLVTWLLNLRDHFHHG
jgi:hypothetical protein